MWSTTIHWKTRKLHVENIHVQHASIAIKQLIRIDMWFVYRLYHIRWINKNNISHSFCKSNAYEMHSNELLETIETWTHFWIKGCRAQCTALRLYFVISLEKKRQQEETALSINDKCCSVVLCTIWCDRCFIVRYRTRSKIEQRSECKM